MSIRALLLLAIPALLCAQTPRNRAPLPNEQWVKLFNGKDLTGWVPVGHEKWTVEEGTIHGLALQIRTAHDAHRGVGLHHVIREPAGQD